MYISILEILFILFYFSMWLYSLVNKNIILSFNNSKLNRYDKMNNLQNITDNFDNTKITNFNSKSIFSTNNLINLISPNKNKQEAIILLITLTIIILIINIRFKLIFSNFIYIKILNKNFDLVSFLYPRYKCIKILYSVMYFICVFSIINLFFKSNFICKLYYFLNKKNILENQQNLNKIILNNEVIIGKDVNNNLMYINKNGLFQNVLITGSIGTGKTSGAILNILDGLLKNNFTGLIIDIKGNFVNYVEKLCTKYNISSKLKIISLENDFKYNPIDFNISEIEIAAILKKVLILLSESNNNSDSFWIDKVESYIRDFLPIIKIYNGYLNFTEIHKIVINNDYLINKIKFVKKYILTNNLSDEILFKLNSSINNLENEYLKLDDRTLNIVKAEITRITSVFVSDYLINNKFCSKNDPFDIYNDIVVLSIGIGKNKVLTKILATYLKLFFQRTVLSNNSSKINCLNSIFFLCDEFQEICNEEDADFFSLSREYRCINVISTQSYSSLINSLRNEQVAKVIIQNLVNKIWFRNDDLFTVNEIIKQIGKERKVYKNINISESGQNTRYSNLNNKFFDYKTGITKGYTYNKINEYKISEDFITTKLNTFEAVCMLSDGISVRCIDKVIFKRWES